MESPCKIRTTYCLVDTIQRAKNVNDIRTRKLEPRAAALMGALMTADGAWSDPKISISIVRIPET